MSLARFGVRKPVVANLVMFALIGAGLIFGLGLRREFFPHVEPTVVAINAPYPGASPDEVEKALAIKIEDSVADLTGVDEITTTVREGSASVMVKFVDGTNIDATVADVKREIDALQDLPDAADRITVLKIEPNLPAISASIYGDADERVKKDFIRAVRDDLETLPGMGDITIDGVRADEISVECRPAALIEHRLSLPVVAERIRTAMTELPGGSVRTGTASVSIRAMGIDESAETIRQIVVKALPGGQVVRLGEIAEVRDAFVDADWRVRLNGEPTASLTVFKGGDDDIINIAEMVKAYVAGRIDQDWQPTTKEYLLGFIQKPGTDKPVSARHEAWLLGQQRWRQGPPPGTFTTTTDLARFVRGRLDLLTRNAMYGGVLVFLVLFLLLNWRVSMWVAVGLVISMLGTIAVMRMFNITLNLLTMFGLIVVIGILVDDAIVVAENIARRHEEGEPSLVAAVRGTNEVAWPVVATVLTTICAFLPLALIEGQLGDFLKWLPLVVVCALSISLIESLFILPVHMAHSLRVNDEHHDHPTTIFARMGLHLDRVREGLFSEIITPGYLWLLHRAVHYRYIALSVALMVLISSMGLVAGGRVGFTLFENNDAETINVTLTMPVGTPVNETDRVLGRIEAIARAQPEVRSVWAIAGAVSDLEGAGGDATQSHLGQLILELIPVEERDRTSIMLTDDIRTELGVVPGLKSLRMEGMGAGPTGPGLTYTVIGSDDKQVHAAVARVEEAFAQFDGVVGIANDADGGKRELRLHLRDGASELGFTQASLGRQVQGAVFGLEAFTFAGDREDVDVRVMLPTTTRQSLSGLERMIVFTPTGTPVPLCEIARIEEASSFATIKRLDRKRAVTVSADVLDSAASPELIDSGVGKLLKEIEADMPGVTIEQRGRQKETADSFSSLPIGMAVASGLIYIILAWLFGSFTQPLIVMTAVPFATIGMIWGHLVLGYSMTFLSLIGFVALSGIVVNDSLIFMEFFNHRRRDGDSVYDAAISAGRARVRAIILTTVTTVFGLLPLMLEQSFQAKFLIPMAITIACGLLSATLVILVVLPCLLKILEDVTHLARILWTGDHRIERANPFKPDPELAMLDQD